MLPHAIPDENNAAARARNNRRRATMVCMLLLLTTSMVNQFSRQQHLYRHRRGSPNGAATQTTTPGDAQNSALYDDGVGVWQQFGNVTLSGYFELSQKLRGDAEAWRVAHRDTDQRKNMTAEQRLLVYNTMRALQLMSLQGNWSRVRHPQSESIQGFLGDFAKGDGLTDMYFVETFDSDLRVHLYAYEGAYVDGKRVFTSIPLRFDAPDHIPSFVAQTSPLDGQDQPFDVVLKNVAFNMTQYDGMHAQDTTKMVCDIYFAFGAFTTHENSRLNADQVHAKVQSHWNCGKEGQFFSSVAAYSRTSESKYISYSLFATTLLCLMTYGVLRLIKRILTDGTNVGQQYSLTTLAFIFVWDGSQSILHLLQSFVRVLYYQTVRWYLIMPAMVGLVLWFGLERNLLLFLWEQRQDEVNQASLVIMRRLQVRFYAKLFLAMLVCLIMYGLHIYDRWFLIIINLYMVPQIVHNAVHSINGVLDWNYVLRVLIPHTVYVLYARACPDNIFRMHAYLVDAILVLILVGAQVAVLYLQSVRGSRFFVPKRFLPQQYNYFIEIPENIDIESQSENSEFLDDCVICLHPLHENSPDMSAAQNARNPFYARFATANANVRQIMKTPCQHKFHVACLLEWMAIKMECPFCRQKLPPLG